MLELWRIVKKRHQRRSLSGEGARLYGGRWNQMGTAVVYTSSTLSLAALELLVHLDADDAPEDLIAVSASVPDGASMRELKLTNLPKNWRDYPAPESLKAIGGDWVSSEKSLVLSVPSVIVPHERNFLLNPAHREFSTVKTHRSMPFSFDPRLWK